MHKNLLILFSFLLISCFLIGCDHTNNDDVITLKIATSIEKEKEIKTVVSQFNSSQEQYNIELDVSKSDDKLYYYLRNDAIDADMVTFDNLNDANLYQKQLQPLNQFEAVAKYQSTIINYIKTEDDILNAIPAPGHFYTQCYNKDLFEQHNFNYPETISDLINLARRMQDYQGSCITYGDIDMYMNILMEIAIPTFVASTKGVTFMKDFYVGNTSIEESPYLSEWQTIFLEYLSLFRYEYYKTSFEGYSIEDASNIFFNGKYHSILNTPEFDADYEYNQRDPNFECVLYPFVGRTANQKWVASKPLYYIGIQKKAIQNEDHLNGIEAFLEYYVSEEGQMAALSDENGNTRNNCVSYVKDIPIVLNEFHQPLEEALRTGKVCLVDTFESIFSLVSNHLKEYVNDELSMNDLIRTIDLEIKEHSKEEKADYNVTSSFDYPEKTITSETRIGNYIIDAVRLQTNVNAAILPSNIIDGNLFSGNLYESDLPILFNDTTCYAVQIRGSGLKKIVFSMSNENFLLISGIRIHRDSSDLYFLNNQKIRDDQLVYILIPEIYLDEYQDDIVALGKSFSIINLLQEYFKTENKITPPKKDGRYGE